MFDRVIELDVPLGIEHICRAELAHKLGITTIEVDTGAVRFAYQGDLKRLSSLKSANAAYVVLTYNIPRPKALLGHQNFELLVDAVAHVLRNGSFKTIGLNAAGSNSSVMERLKDEIAAHSSLEVASDSNADLLVRIRKKSGRWQVLLRTTARPLSVRGWRIHDMKGALNGPVAYAMNNLIPSDATSVINFMCGSGTLLIEHDDLGHERKLYGLDTDEAVLGIAADHLRMVANANHQTTLVRGNATRTPFRDKLADAITADMPFGQLVGTHEANKTLYPAVLAEMYRVLSGDGRAILLTHEVRLMSKIITGRQWAIEKIIKVDLRGLHPRIYVLRKI